MGRYTAAGEGSFKQPPTGNQVARCYRILDLGTQHGDWQGKPTVNNQILLQFELPKQLMDNGEPYSVSIFINNFLGTKAKKSKLRILLETWRNKPFSEEEVARFDLNKVLGKAGIVTLIEKEAGGKVVIAGVGPLMDGMECPPAVNPLMALWLDEWDDEKWKRVPEGLQKIIARSDEYRALFSKRSEAFGDNGDPTDDRPQGVDDDDIAF